MTITPNDLQAITGRTSLFAFLRDKLRWPLDAEDPYAYDESEAVGRAAAHAALSRLLPFTAGDPFVIFLVEFTAAFRRTDLRDILRGVRRKIHEQAAYQNAGLEDMVFVCATPGYDGLRFAHFEERMGQSPRLRVFGYDRESLAETRTLREVNLPALGLALTDDDRPDWTACQKDWLSAWDVERVTAEFFREYKIVFAGVEEKLTGVSGDRRLWTQRLFNRLLFVQFLSKKGWLRFGGRRDYLAALWEGRDTTANFYHAHLSPLFFAGLNNPQCRQLNATDSVLYSRIGDVPFLNGGLFEKAEGETGSEGVLDASVRAIFDLFSRFNFTLAESTPDDVHVAVDPEMLGKVFEELVTEDERHGTGSYYTPRGIVAFMCREALKGYLGGGAAIDAFVDAGDPSQLADPETVLSALKNVTICDPACGSGAYLVGAMQELLRLRERLFAAKAKDYQRIYDRKLEIIQRNLYGVDREAFAVNTAMLRLWLSLVVDDERDPLDPAQNVNVSLPNLTFKVQVGDSLAAPDPAPDKLALLGEPYIADARRLAALYAEYFKASGVGCRQKALIETDIRSSQGEIAKLIGTEVEKKVVDWRIVFAEAFAPQEAVSDWSGAMNLLGDRLADPAKLGGFDIVLANPPYVRQELIKEQKPTLKVVFPEVYVGTADLFCYFYARAVQLLRPGGMLAFISSNKWFRAGYGAKLRAHLAQTCRVVSITDFGELPVFQSAATFPMIFMAQKGSPGGSVTFTQVKSLAAPYPDVLALIRQSGSALPAAAITGADWTLTDAKSAARLQTMEAAGKPLGEYVNGQIFRGVLTGFNAAFVIDGPTRAALIEADANSAEIIKPLAVGDDVRRWRITEKDRWLIFTRRGVKIDDYPAVKAHLSQWKAELTPKKTGEEPKGRKPGSYKWYEIQDEVAYYAAFAKPKILYQEIATFQRFAFDETGAFVNNKVFMISVSDLFLLGVLNASAAWEYLGEKCGRMIAGAYAMQTPAVSKLPIPDATNAQKAAISGLVQKCLDAKGVGCAAWEAEIDAQVSALYGL